MLVEYPTEPPIDSVSAIINGVRNKNFDANFAKHAWNVQGYAMGVALGKGDAVRACNPLSDEDACAALETLTSPNMMALPIPWLTIAKWIGKILIEYVL